MVRAGPPIATGLCEEYGNFDAQEERASTSLEGLRSPFSPTFDPPPTHLSSGTCPGSVGTGAGETHPRDWSQAVGWVGTRPCTPPTSPPSTRGPRATGGDDETKLGLDPAYGTTIPSPGPSGSGEDVADDPAVDVGQAEVAAGVAVGEPLVVEARAGAGSSRGSRGRGPGSRPTSSPIVVGRAVDDARPSRRRRPARRRSTSGWWLAARSGRRCAGVRPNSVVQTTSVSSSMPARLRSCSSPAIGLVDVLGQRDVVRHVAVRVPVVRRAGVDQLDEPHAALGQPAGDQALPGEALGARRAPGRRAAASRRSPSTGRTPRASRAACRRPSRTSGSAPASSGSVGRCLQVPAVERGRAGPAPAPARPRCGERRLQVGIGSAPGTTRVPWWQPGRKSSPRPACRRRAGAGRGRRTTAGSGSPSPGRS